MIGFYLRWRKGLELREPCRGGENLPEMIGVSLEPRQEGFLALPWGSLLKAGESETWFKAPVLVIFKGQNETDSLHILVSC